MPALMEFHEKYKAHRDKFQILAFHSASAPDFAMLDKKMGPIIKKIWKGKALPFPILLDSTGRTLRNFSVTSLGTHTLIDPEGNVVQGHAEATIEAAIKKSIERALEKEGPQPAAESQGEGVTPRKRNPPGQRAKGNR